MPVITWDQKIVSALLPQAKDCGRVVEDGYGRQLPAMLLRHGLLQTAAFLTRKLANAGDDAEDPTAILRRLLVAGLDATGTGLLPPSANGKPADYGLVERVAGLGLRETLLATDLAVRVATWIQRLGEAHLREEGAHV